MMTRFVFLAILLAFSALGASSSRAQSLYLKQGDSAFTIGGGYNLGLDSPERSDLHFLSVSVSLDGLVDVGFVYANAHRTTRIPGYGVAELRVYALSTDIFLLKQSDEHPASVSAGARYTHNRWSYPDRWVGALNARSYFVFDAAASRDFLPNVRRFAGLTAGVAVYPTRSAISGDIVTGRLMGGLSVLDGNGAALILEPALLMSSTPALRLAGRLLLR